MRSTSAREDVADGAGDEVALGVQLDRALGRVGASSRSVSQRRVEVLQVALDLGLALADAGGADDEADVLRRLELVEDLPQAAALVARPRSCG